MAILWQEFSWTSRNMSHFPGKALKYICPFWWQWIQDWWIWQMGVFHRGHSRGDTTCSPQSVTNWICMLPASSWMKEHSFSVMGSIEVRMGFSSMPVSLSFRYVWIPLLVRDFWEPLDFFNLLHLIFLSFFFKSLHMRDKVPDYLFIQWERNDQRVKRFLFHKKSIIINNCKYK